MKDTTSPTGHHPSATVSSIDRSAPLLLFPGCDPRGVMMRALAPEATKWTTRPDALVFAWRLALAPGMDVARAAGAVVTAATSCSQGRWSEAQRELVVRLEDVATGRRSSPACDIDVPHC